MTTPPIRVLLADDQDMVRAGLRLICETAGGIDVVAEATHGTQAVTLAQRLRPDVAVLDVRMPGIDGVEATRRITATAPGVKVIVLTTFDLDEYVYGALRAGAVGFLVKSGDPQALIDAVRLAVRGEHLLAPTVVHRLLAHHERQPAPDLSALSPREREVLGLVGEALSNTEIAERLGISVNTVKTFLSATLTKLGLRNRVQAAITAHQAGLTGTTRPPDAGPDEPSP